MKRIGMKLLLLGVVMISLQISARAQDVPDDPDEIPLDPGSWVLMAAGVGYGVKKWRDAKQNTGKNTEEKTIDFPGDSNMH